MVEGLHGVLRSAKPRPFSQQTASGSARLPTIFNVEELLNLNLVASLSHVLSDTLTIDDLTRECQRLINLKHDTSVIQNQKSTESNAVAIVKTDKQRKPQVTNSNKSRNLQGKKQIKNSLPNKDSTPSTPCWFCGQLHYSKFCTFKNHKCQKCNTVGHKDGYCASTQRVKTKTNNETANQNVKTIKVNQVNSNLTRKFVNISINNQPIKLQLDTGSDITIISEKIWSLLGKPTGCSTSHVARDASGNQINFNQEIYCEVTLNGVIKQLRCFVTANSDLNIMGLDWIAAFDLWQCSLNSFCSKIHSQADSTHFDISFIKENFKEVFSSQLGRCTKTKVKLNLKNNSKPIFRPKRPVAYAILPLVDAELTRLEQNGIISPIKYSDWATPIVVVRKKNGKIRICPDFSTGLNESLEPNRYPLPLPDEIFSQLSNCKYFSQLDLSDAFLQIEIEEQSRHLLTINTHRGLYVYNRLPFGVTIAPGEFQSIMDSMISGLENVFAYIDDIVVGGATVQEHNQNLTYLLERIKDYGLHLQIEKCCFFTTQINYLGYVIDGQGLHPDPTKVEAIKNMPEPHNLTTLRSFLGVINYYARFISNMHILRRPLDNLLKKDSKWNWSPKCQESFNQFKRILSSKLLLTHYNPQNEIIVAADASNEGLGACILHRFPDHSIKVISHASRSLTEAERKYSQIEKEALAIIFAVTKFHRMIFGRQFILQTDHKPLLQIFGNKKGIPSHTANRLQRWALQLLSYDFKIEYIKTTEFGHADVLSRLISHQQRPEEDFVIASVKMETDLFSVLNESLQSFPITFQQIKEATKEDDIIQKVINFTSNSWPQNVDDSDLQPFFRRRNSLTVIQECLLFNDRVVIPQQFHQQILKQLHKGHPGMERMKIIARSYVYWPRIDQQIEEFVRNCRNCALAAKSPIKVPLSSWSLPEKPWQRVHIDFAGPLNGEYYFVLVDAFSKWPEIVPTQTITAQRTIDILQEIFARFGVPESLVSDNGTQFTSEKFQNFCLLQGINHLHTPPFHPSSNG
ncbi:PREDICTED: uncharacterized protein K02A2.6-like [Cyphomyrmex costatus]|uniref:uncharacterized protein K02A2.6-like n=1 Tax=Cyphomyrmex costatus TaxID=456900 RepID=UPI00085241AD|nr:PREDICTED: uncharacterized protein K02A2.6-like [Cyphomyrmex costatus]